MVLQEREAAFRSFLDGEQVREEARDYGESKLEAALVIMRRNCPECGAGKWDCRCGQIWGNGCTLEGHEGYRRTEVAACTTGEYGEERSEEEEEFDIDELAAWIEGTPKVKAKKSKQASPEGVNARKKKTGGRRTLFSSK